ncbi:Lon protease family protein [Sansalvadorimonas verongulae]|uniref:Lon protease family protein n=1 Tax=Sansalvadorimonas verongulae TaxID=2172824 RepID=UPI0012BB843A|nr:ATP-binding protein [Sansalvadorimonas verongulae]MTI12895.1 ATP-dependent protease [Sansalvadorimonas verongulae]
MSKAVTQTKVPATQLTARQSVKELGFKNTDELELFAGILGQERAETAIRFGVSMQRAGYNIYVMGESGTGRTSYIRHYLEGEAKTQDAPEDWAYVNNFDNPREPSVLRLPVGTGSKLQKDFTHLVDELMDTFPAAFESPSYQQKKSLIERKFNRSYDKAIETVEQEGLRRDICLFREQGSLTFAPMYEGKPMDETEFAQLPDRKRNRFNKDIAALETLLNEELSELPQWKRTSSEELRTLNYQAIDKALEPLLKSLQKEYGRYAGVTEYLEAMKTDLHKAVVEHLADERGIEFKEDAGKRNLLRDMYVPNIVVGHKENDHAPVVFETHPSYRNLFGRIEYTTEMGALLTSYRQICSGSLHRANGGYLVMEAAKLLEEPFVWEALKRAMKEKQLKIESPASEMGLVNTITLNPEIIPLNVKIVLLGSRQIYYLLQELDADFHEMFRVLVDFDGHLERTPETTHSFARLLHTRASDEGYPPLTAQAVARMVEYSSRLAEHKRHLSAHIGDLFNLLAEADFIRRDTRGRKITHIHVDKALAAKAERTGRVSKEILKEVLEGSVLIDSDGEAVGKINALTVLSIGDTSFGSPARITAAVYPGSQGIVDVEREVQLGQAIHSKGVMILTGYLGAKYAQKFPLAISASLAMEQSYGYVDGDSASMAELCCLLSALTGVPIKQSWAITGSMNQHGEVQAIGGVNEKIEGFFDLCNARGLTGDQGVIIPTANVRNLMLSERVLAAVKLGQFSVHAVSHVEEALEILTGMKPGALNSRGKYPKNSLNERVLTRLMEIAELSKENN